MSSFLRRCVASGLPLLFLLPVPARGLTADQWRADLAALDEAIRTVHASPFHTVTEEAFTQMVQDLHDAIPTASETQIIVGMASIVAAVNDGHTRLTGWHRNTDLGFHTLPLALYWFSDGLYVRQAHPDYAELVGARVTRIGNLSAEEAQQRIEAVVAADNRFGEIEEGPHYLISPEVMQAVGILDAGDQSPYTLEKDGRTWSPELAPLEGEWPGWTRGFVNPAAGWIDARDQQDPGSAALWQRHIDQTLWCEYLPDHKLLYVQENAVRDGETETQAQFYARVMEAFEANDVEKLVLDVRLNGGGNNYLNRPALTTLVRAEASAELFVVIGRQTFSACQNLVNEISRWTDAVFVGEPTSERVNFYGDTRPTELPHSGLVVRASWLWWQNMDPRDTRDALYPDLAADLSFAQYVRNEDPALDLIVEFEGILDAAGVTGLMEREGIEAVRSALRDAVHDPAFRHRNLESEINELGYRLVGERRMDEAIAVFTLNTEEFPDSFNTWDSLAETLERVGDQERALELYRKSLDLNPSSPTGLAAVERLEGRNSSSGVPRH